MMLFIERGRDEDMSLCAVTPAAGTKTSPSARARGRVRPVLSPPFRVQSKQARAEMSVRTSLTPACLPSGLESEKALNKFPASLADFVLPEAGKLTIKYDDSGVSVVTEGAVSETTFAHLTDLLLDNAEAEAGGIDRGDDAALMASMDPSNFDDAKLMKVSRSPLL